MTDVTTTEEAARLAALRSCGVLDTAPEEAFDDLTRVAAAVCGTPIALVSLIDYDRQWFKSRVGLAADETPRDVAFCAHAIRAPGRDLFVVPDAAADPRFADNPLVTGHPFIRFYAGAPLVTPDGFALGTLCVIDTTPRTLSADQAATLRALARQAVAQLELRRKFAELERTREALAASEGRFRAFMDHSPAVAYMKAEDGRFVYVNAPLTRRFRLSEAAFLGRTDADLFPGEYADEYRAHDRAVLAGGVPVVLDESSPDPDGGVTHWRSYKFPFTGPCGERFLAGMSVDVTDEQKAADALRASETKFRNTVDRLAEGVFVVDAAAGRLVEANAALLAMLGYTAAEFLSLTPFDLAADETPAAFADKAARVEAVLARHGRCDPGQARFRRKDGAVILVDLRVTLVPDGGAGLHAVIVRDVTEELEHRGRLIKYQQELEAANARLRAAAGTDGLTGLRNRAAFDERLAEEAAGAARHGRPLSLILLDVDHFKPFNDTFGHPAGDDVLRAVAELLRGAVRATDTVARYGGEEFAVILPDTDRTGAGVLAERVRRAVAGGPWRRRAVTVSVGAAEFAPGAACPAGLVDEADRALYRAKQAGRNRVVLADGAAQPAAR